MRLTDGIIGHITEGTGENLSPSERHLTREILDRGLKLVLAQNSYTPYFVSGGGIPRGHTEVYTSPAVTDPEVAARLGALVAESWSRDREMFATYAAGTVEALDNFVPGAIPAQPAPALDA